MPWPRTIWNSGLPRWKRRSANSGKWSSPTRTFHGGKRSPEPLRATRPIWRPWRWAENTEIRPGRSRPEGERSRKMIVLDTNMMSVLEWRDTPKANTIVDRLDRYPAKEIATTIITYEE